MDLNAEVEQMIRKEVLEIVSRHLDIQQYKVFYFGSRVNGTNKERSDINIGIEGNETVPYDKFHQILNDIDNIRTLYKIDFVDFKDCSEAFVNLAKMKVEYIYDYKVNSNRGLIIEELKEFGRKELSFIKLIYSKYEINWLFRGTIMMSIALVFFVISFKHLENKNWESLTWVSFIIWIPMAIYLVYFLRNKTLLVLKDKYEVLYKLDLSNGWKYNTILIIRLKKFREKIEMIGVKNNEQIQLVINALEYESNSNKYSYKLSENVGFFVLGAILSNFLINSSFSELIYLGLIISLPFFYFDRFILREIILHFRNRDKILIQTIYNYIIEG